MVGSARELFKMDTSLFFVLLRGLSNKSMWKQWRFNKQHGGKSGKSITTQTDEIFDW